MTSADAPDSNKAGRTGKEPRRARKRRGGAKQKKRDGPKGDAGRSDRPASSRGGGRARSQGRQVPDVKGGTDEPQLPQSFVELIGYLARLAANGTYERRTWRRTLPIVLAVNSPLLIVVLALVMLLVVAALNFESGHWFAAGGVGGGVFAVARLLNGWLRRRGDLTGPTDDPDRRP